MIPYPCPLVQPEVPQPPPLHGREACVDWKDEHEARDVESAYEKGGSTFQANSQDSLRIVLWGSPEGQGKLTLPQKGMRVLSPFAADRVVAHLGLYTWQPIILEALDRAGNEVGPTTTVPAQGEMQTLEVKAADITTLLFAGGGNEGLLIDLCAY